MEGLGKSLRVYPGSGRAFFGLFCLLRHKIEGGPIHIFNLISAIAMLTLQHFGYKFYPACGSELLNRNSLSGGALAIKIKSSPQCWRLQEIVLNSVALSDR